MMISPSMATPSRNVVTTRSKGCRTCRTRKVRCDQTHPFCQRCVRARITCQGYSAAPTTTSMEAPRATGEPSLLAEPRALPYAAEPKHIACLARGMLVGKPGDGQAYSFLHHGLTVSKEQSYLLHTAARCLARVFYGRQFRLRDAMTDGLVRYGEMLQVLGSEVAAQTSAVPMLDLIQVVVICILLEAVVAHPVGKSSFSGLHSHIGGLAQIIRLRGPKALQLNKDLLPLEVCRCYIVGRAIYTRTPTFMAEPQWKTVPWKYEEKHPFTEVFDIMCDLPGLLYDLERLHLSSIKWPVINQVNWPVLEVQGSIVNPTHNLSLKLKDMLQNLINWRWKWDHHCNRNTTTVLIDPVHSVITDSQGAPEFQSCLSYSDIAIKEILYYQATLVLVLRICKLIMSNDLLDKVDKTPPPHLAQPLPPTALLRPTDINSLEDASREFYRSMEGHLCGGGGDKPAAEFYQLTFPLSLVSLGIDEDSLEQTWMDRIRLMMIKANGFNLFATDGERSTGSATDEKP